MESMGVAATAIGMIIGLLICEWIDRKPVAEGGEKE